MKVNGRLSFSLLIGLVISACAFAAQEQSYPTRAVRLVAPSSTGGGTDITARIIAPKLGEHLRHQIIVENRPGAATMIGSEIVARSLPDGYTLMLCSTPLATNPAIHKKMPYDALRDFAPITQIVSMPNMLVSHPSLPVRSVKQLIAFAKSRPGRITSESSRPLEPLGRLSI